MLVIFERIHQLRGISFQAIIVPFNENLLWAIIEQDIQKISLTSDCIELKKFYVCSKYTKLYQF